MIIYNTSIFYFVQFELNERYLAKQQITLIYYACIVYIYSKKPSNKINHICFIENDLPWVKNNILNYNVHHIIYINIIVPIYIYKYVSHISVMWGKVENHP